VHVLLRRLIDVREGETGALGWAAAYFFLVLMAYYILRPVRDTMGVAGGVENLPWLFTATVLVMLAVNPAFSALVARFGRSRFIPISYRFFAANLLVFYLLLNTSGDPAPVWLGRVFYVWTAVFSLFVVSIFWAFLSDVFSTPQSKRLYGFIGVGGTLGAITGAGVTAFFVGLVGTPNLMLLSAVLLEGSLFAVRRIPLHARRFPDVEVDSAEGKEQPIGGDIMAGISHTFRSPYLLGIAAYILIYTITSTVLYYAKIDIVARTFSEPAAQTAFFAKIDVAVNVATVLTQMFLTGRIIRALGVGLTLGILPAISVVGFAGLGLLPTLGILVAFESLRRAGNYALARPARETLFTVVTREDRYKAKTLIDTFVYRGGDVVGIWYAGGLSAGLGLGLGTMSLVTAPLAGIWLLLGWWLGRKQRERAEERAARTGAYSPAVPPSRSRA